MTRLSQQRMTSGCASADRVGYAQTIQVLGIRILRQPDQRLFSGNAPSASEVISGGSWRNPMEVTLLGMVTLARFAELGVYRIGTNVLAGLDPVVIAWTSIQIQNTDASRT